MRCSRTRLWPSGSAMPIRTWILLPLVLVCRRVRVCSWGGGGVAVGGGTWSRQAVEDAGLSVFGQASSGAYVR